MKHKHRPCPCGCGDMADECMAPHAWRNPLGAFQIVEPYTPPTVEDLEREDRYVKAMRLGTHAVMAVADAEQKILRLQNEAAVKMIRALTDELMAAGAKAPTEATQ